MRKLIQEMLCYNFSYGYIVSFVYAKYGGQYGIDKITQVIKDELGL